MTFDNESHSVVLNLVQAAQMSSANTDPSRPSQSHPTQGMDTARAVLLVLIPLR